MRTISMERLCVLDVACGGCPEVRGFLRQLSLATFFHEDNIEEGLAFAKFLKVPRGEFSSYAWIQTYVREAGEDFGEVPACEVVAKQFGISGEDFRSYLHSRAQQLHNELVEAELHDTVMMRGDVEEDFDFLDDLQEDGGRRGLASE